MKKSFLSIADVKNKCDTFIGNVKYYISRYTVKNIYNSNQSRFQLKFHFGHILLHNSIEKVKSVVQSTSATMHSYTTQPTISTDVRLYCHLFLLY